MARVIPMERASEFLRETIGGLGEVTGGIGLFLVAFCDSSFLSLPEVNDLLLVYFATRFKERAYFYAAMAVAGSAAGCFALHGLGRAHGYRYLRRRYGRGRLERTFALFRRYGAFAVLVPALLPPPFPFKIFVLSSGVFGVPLPRFAAAVLVGRSARYFGEAAAAVRYGDRALELVREHYLAAAAALVAATALGLVAVALWSRWAGRLAEEGAGADGKEGAR